MPVHTFSISSERYNNLRFSFEANKSANLWRISGADIRRMTTSGYFSDIIPCSSNSNLIQGGLPQIISKPSLIQKTSINSNIGWKKRYLFAKRSAIFKRNGSSEANKVKDPWALVSSSSCVLLTISDSSSVIRVPYSDASRQKDLSRLATQDGGEVGHAYSLHPRREGLSHQLHAGYGSIQCRSHEGNPRRVPRIPR